VTLSLNGFSLDHRALIDSGASFCAPPRTLGDQFGEDWDLLPRLFRLGGVAGGVRAKLLAVDVTIPPFPIRPIMFGWAETDVVPLIFGQMTFFLEFHVCFFRALSEFQLQLSSSTP